MPRAHSDDIAWRVIMRWREFGQSPSEIGDEEHGLGVSQSYVLDVIRRYQETGDVATHQGRRVDPLATRAALTRYEDHNIVQLVVSSPRVTLKEHLVQFKLDTGVLISYSVFCRAVHRLGYTRKHIRALAYQCDEDRANEWLREVLTYYSAKELGVLDETSKDYDVLKGSYGYSLRGSTCSAHDQHLSHKVTRMSALCLYTVENGFTDWAFTSGNYNKDYFLQVTTEYFTDWRGIRRPPMSLPHIKPGQRRCCLILLDNASIHHCHEFDKRVTAIPGASVRFIPPYCHALSPLDNGAFGALVRWLQRHHHTTCNR